MRKFDYLIVGAGVFGLNIAYRFAKAGAHVALVDESMVGDGASGGLLGSLMPYMPNNWNAKKQFQYEALMSLPHHVAELKHKSGIDSGYSRVGRLMPIHKQGFLRQITLRAPKAKEQWGDDYFIKIFEDKNFDGWPEVITAKYGYVLDNFSARINPREYLQALLKSYLELGGVFMPHTSILSNELLKQEFTSNTGEIIGFEQVILTAGAQSFSLLSELGYKGLGEGVVGQAILVELKSSLESADLPILYDDQVYIIPHSKKLVAIGSTSIPWEDLKTPPHPKQETTDELLKKAVRICPLLEDAKVTKMWCGIRPKAIGREPMVGFLPAHPHIYVATGGFKIGIGIAHKIAEDVEMVLLHNHAAEIPENFKLHSHLDLAKKNA